MSDTSPAPTHVLVRHSVTGGEWECPTTYLDTAVEDGWVLVTDSNAGDNDTPTPTAYDDFTIPGLKAEIEQRNTEYDEDAQLSTAGNKPDLIATLIADDARRTNGSDS